MNKKGQLGNLQGIILVLVIVGILIGAGYLIITEVLDELDENSFTRTNETTAYIRRK